MGLGQTLSNVDSFVHGSTLVSAREASRLLGVRLTTLYAYVSRGFLTSHAAQKHRARRYDRDEVMRLKARHDARAGHAPAAATALDWGAPVLDSAITEISDAGPRYRGHLATDLVEAGATFEDVVELLVCGALPAPPAHAPPLSLGKGSKRLRSLVGPGSRDALSRLPALVAALAIDDESRFPLAREAEIVRGRAILAETPWIVAPPAWSSLRARLVRSPEPISRVLCALLALEPTARRTKLVDAILILCADHELNVSAFAARVVTSAGADLYAALSAAAAALSGPLHGGSTARAEALVAEIGSPRDAARVVAARARRGEMIPGVGHPVYPRGDPRGTMLLALAKREARAIRRCGGSRRSARRRASTSAPITRWTSGSSLRRLPWARPAVRRLRSSRSAAWPDGSPTCWSSGSVGRCCDLGRGTSGLWLRRPERRETLQQRERSCGAPRLLEAPTRVLRQADAGPACVRSSALAPPPAGLLARAAFGKRAVASRKKIGAIMKSHLVVLSFCLLATACDEQGGAAGSAKPAATTATPVKSAAPTATATATAAVTATATAASSAAAPPGDLTVAKAVEDVKTNPTSYEGKDLKISGLYMNANAVTSGGKKTHNVVVIESKDTWKDVSLSCELGETAPPEGLKQYDAIVIEGKGNVSNTMKGDQTFKSLRLDPCKVTKK